MIFDVAMWRQNRRAKMDTTERLKARKIKW